MAQVPGKEDFITEYKDLLHIEDCQAADLRKMQIEYEKVKHKNTDVFLEKLGIKVTHYDYDLLNSFGQVTPNLMVLALNVLKIVHGFSFPFTMGLVIILNPDNADYLEYDSMKENEQLQFPAYNPQVHKYLGLVMYIKQQKRWICTVQSPKELEGMLVDFFDDKKKKIEKMKQDIMQMFSESFNIDIDEKVYRLHVHNQKSQLIKTDFGALIFNYMYKFFQSRDVLKTSFIDEELGVLCHQRLLWLLHQIKKYEAEPKYIKEDLILKKIADEEGKHKNQIDLREEELKKYKVTADIPQIENYKEKEVTNIKKKYDKLELQQRKFVMLTYDYESFIKSNFITPKLMNFLTVYLDVNDKMKFQKGIYFGQINVLSTPDDDYFEYDLLRIDKDSDGNINKERDKLVVFLIYYKYKWALALYDLQLKTGFIQDYKSDDNQDINDLYSDLQDVFKIEFRMSVDDFQMSNNLEKIKDQGDAGVNVFHLIYKFLTDKKIQDVTFKEKEKKYFRPKVEWLLLKFWEIYYNETEERKIMKKKLEEQERLRKEAEDKDRLLKMIEEEEKRVREEELKKRAEDYVRLKMQGRPAYSFAMQAQGTQTPPPNLPIRPLQATGFQSIQIQLKDSDYKLHPLNESQKPFIRSSFDKTQPPILTLESIPEEIRKHPEKEFEDKLFDVLELMNNPQKLEQLNEQNSNIGQYVEKIKQQIADDISRKNKKQELLKPKEGFEYQALWAKNEQGRNVSDLKGVIRQSLDDQKMTRDRVMAKQYQSSLPTSWYFNALANRGNIDPDLSDIIDDIRNSKTQPLDDNMQKYFYFIKFYYFKIILISIKTL